MKKFYILFLAFFLNYSIIYASPIEIFNTGFMGYEWDTDFSIINDDKDLRSAQPTKFGEISYLSYADTKQIYEDRHLQSFQDPQKITVLCLYFFKDNKLTKGSLVFKNSSEFDDSLKTLIDKYGPPFQTSKDGTQRWVLKDMLITVIPISDTTLFGHINFTSLKQLTKPPK